MQSVRLAKTPHEKAMQRALIQYRNPENFDLVREALILAGRQDLIGFDRKKCLIPPRKIKDQGKRDNAQGNLKKKKEDKSKSRGNSKRAGGRKKR